MRECVKRKYHLKPLTGLTKRLDETFTSTLRYTHFTLLNPQKEISAGSVSKLIKAQETSS